MPIAAEKQSEDSFFCVTAWALHHDQAGTQVAVTTDQIQSGDVNSYFLSQYLPSMFQDILLDAIYKFSKTSLPFLFTTFLMVSRGWVNLLASHVLQLPIMTNTSLVWLLLASFVHYFV